MESLIEEFQKHHHLSNEGRQFLTLLEKSIEQDLWMSAGGHWSEASVTLFRQNAMRLLAQSLKGDSKENYELAWGLVVRDFHLQQWGEKRLLKKEKKPLTEEDRTFKELFSYVWVLLQALFITKTAVFYFGLKDAESESGEGRIYLFLAIAFSFTSLIWFAYRKSKKGPDKSE